MKNLGLFIITILLTSSVVGQISYLQYRHVPSDQEEKFIERETKYWSKVAKSAIDKGQMQSWSMWRKVGVTSANPTAHNYVLVNTYKNLDNMDPDKVWSDNLNAMGDVKEEDAETNSFTTIVAEYYVQSEENIPGDYKFALVNYAKPTDLTAFIQENRAITTMACDGLSSLGRPASPSMSRRTGGERARI